MAAVDTIVVGAGGRGLAYGRFANEYPREMRVVGLAEPDPIRRQRFLSEHKVAQAMIFHDWQSLLASSSQRATAIINCTMDRMHYASTMKMLDAGYDVLLEKPMAPVLGENLGLVQKAEETGRLLQICHVLRYTPFWQALRQVVQSGKLGRVISVSHRENLAYYHMAHSFVRGNWRSEATSGPMILSKCCHDFDVLLWILQQKVAYIQSFGSLIHFRPENAPEGATERCTDGCAVADTCKYEATKRYARDGEGWPLNAVSYIPTGAARLERLKTDWYGRCVYHCDNDVVDHQSVNMEMEDGATVSLVMNGQSDEECRTMRWDGTKATLYGKFSARGHEIRVHHHMSGQVEDVPVIARDGSGHGGGDYGILRSFLNSLNGAPDESASTARESLESHLLVFAAEESRLNKTVVDMDEFRARAWIEAGDAEGER
ncbi:MAG: Gfo/Idh/MocA family oxidoreductase [Chloroflexi bacterium]|nr:Gfo/Idh/MocA family oxidoreductase [Chloroflexota bacterium]